MTGLNADEAVRIISERVILRHSYHTHVHTRLSTRGKILRRVTLERGIGGLHIWSAHHLSYGSVPQLPCVILLLERGDTNREKRGSTLPAACRWLPCAKTKSSFTAAHAACCLLAAQRRSPLHSATERGSQKQPAKMR